MNELDRVQVQQAIGHQLRQLRYAYGDRQQDFANRVGRSRPSISKYETAERCLDLGDVIEFAQALNVSPLGLVARLLPETAIDSSMRTLIDALDRNPQLLPDVLSVLRAQLLAVAPPINAPPAIDALSDNVPW